MEFMNKLIAQLSDQQFQESLAKKFSLAVENLELIKNEEILPPNSKNLTIDLNSDTYSIDNDTENYYLNLSFISNQPIFLLYAILIGENDFEPSIDTERIMLIDNKSKNFYYSNRIYLGDNLSYNLTIKEINNEKVSYVYYTGFSMDKNISASILNKTIEYSSKGGDDGDKKLIIGLSVGLGIFGLLVIMILFYLFFKYIMKKRNKKKYTKTEAIDRAKQSETVSDNNLHKIDFQKNLPINTKDRLPNIASIENLPNIQSKIDHADGERLPHNDTNEELKVDSKNILI